MGSAFSQLTSKTLSTTLLSKLDVIRCGLSLAGITTYVAFEREDTIFLYVNVKILNISFKKRASI